MTYRPMSTSLEPSSGASSSCSGAWHATARGGVPPQYGPADRGRLLDFGLPRRARLYDGGHAWRSTTTRASDGGQAIIGPYASHKRNEKIGPRWNWKCSLIAR